MNVQLIAVPYDSARRGERMGAGPELLQTELVRRLEQEGHRTAVRVLDAPTDSWRAEIRTAFDLAGEVARSVERTLSTGGFPLVLSGNCGPAALGCVSALRGSPLVFWFDAHGDFNTPDTTVGGFLDGMSMATLTGHCWPQLAANIPGFAAVTEENVTLIGARDLDPLEAAALERSKVRRVAVDDLRRALPAAIVDTRARSSPAYLHLDLDVLDPREAPINPYQAPNGLSRADVEWAIATITQSERVEAAALTAYDPTSDPEGKGREAALVLGVAVVQAVARRHH
ncbi:MAG TPA: arginase family protein [Gemmatimonadaceae bacterium]|nr:arginase family protein [Gemmatimonadaceae bacterium]